ncbi:retrotransposon protein, putative, ty1-copia subclass [Tanacetum coccineum]
MGVSISFSWAKANYKLEQLDVKTTFLHGNLKEVIYIRQPPGYEQGNKVCLLKKSLYGLKQSPRQWYRWFDEYMLSNGFKRSSYDISVYYKSYAPRKFDMKEPGKQEESWYGDRQEIEVRKIYEDATLQHVVALSTTEAEYMALTEAVKEAIWLRGLLKELGVELNTVAINCDNQGVVLEAKTVKVLKVGTKHNAADALKKVIPGLKLQHCLELLNVGVG